MAGRATLASLVLALLLALPAVANAQYPDLVIQSGSVKVPATGITAQVGHKFTATSTIWNKGTVKFTSTFYMSYWYCAAKPASPYPTTVSGCTLLANQVIYTDFAADQATKITSPTLTVPTTAVYGKGYIVFFADGYSAYKPGDIAHLQEANEKNNTAAGEITVTRRPDIYPYSPYFATSGSYSTVGAKFKGRVYVYNASYTSKITDNFNIRYSYCPAKGTTGCIPMGTQAVTTDINSGAHSGLIDTPWLTMPAGTQNGTRYIQIHVDYDGKVTENNETNNIHYYSISVTQVESDLKITTISAPNTGYTKKAGDKFTVSTTIHNDSKNGFTTDFRISYYYCPTKATTGCTYISYMAITKDFAAGYQETYISTTLTLPNQAMYGVGYIRAWVDAFKGGAYCKPPDACDILESNENNNDAYATINVITKPDLTVYYSNIPHTYGSTATVGSTFKAYMRIRNAASTSQVNPDFKVKYYYCPLKTFANCTFLAEQTITENIAAGGYTGYFYSPTMTMPAGSQNGTRYILVHIDSSNTVSESNETNNYYYDSITVNAVPSDLKVTSVTAPYTGSTTKAGSPFLVHATIHNDSTNGFTTDFYLYYYYCPTTATATANCTYISNRLVVDDFPANQKYSYLSGTLTLPTTAVYGTGYIRVFADATNKIPESGGDNNTRDDTITVTTRPDLYAYYAQFPYTGGTSTIGSQFTGRMRIRNNASTSKVTTDFELTYHFCPSNTTSGCTKIGSQKITTDLNSGAYTGYFYTPTMKIPAGAQNGTRYIRTHVDSGNTVTESNETNNNTYTAITVSHVTSDLLISKTTAPASGTTTKAGDKFSVSCEVHNSSTNGFSNDFYIYYYYCQNANTTGCTYIAYTTVSDNFSAGQKRTYHSGTLTMPVQAVYGSGYIRFFVDATLKVTESNENNNNAYDAITVGAKPDLYVGATSVPYSGTTTGPGAKFKGRYRIYNKASTSKVVTDFSVDFYYCPSNTTTGCVKIGTQKITTDINTGSYGGYFYTPDLTLPTTVKTGTRYIRFVVDSGGAVVESDETNNNYYDAITVSSQQPDLTIIAATAPASGTLTGAGSKFTVKSTVNCSGSKVSTNFDMHYYYCTSNAATSCTQIGTQAIVYDFKANESKEFISSLLTLPNTAVYGKGYIRFYVDANNAVTEGSESNNEVYKQVTLNGKPDLSLVAATVPYTGSVSKPSSTFTAQYTIANASNTNAFSTDFVVSFYFCTAKSAGSCTALSTVKVTQDFKSGSQYTLTSPTLTIPATAKPGSYFLRIWADSGNAVSEFDENNNDRWEGISVIGDPDFVVSTFTVKTNNKTVDYSVMVCNLGDSTTKAFDLELYFNQAATPTCTSKSDHQWAITGLAKTTCTTKTFTRLNVPVGIYLGWARVDADCGVKESDENNNNKSAAYTVSLPPDLGPDMGPDMGPDLGPDMGPDLGPDMGPDVGPEAGTNEGGVNEGGTNEAGTNEGGVNEGGVNEAGVNEAGTENEGGVPTEAGTENEGGVPTEAGTNEGGVDDGAKPDQDGKKDVSVNFEGGAGSDASTTPDGGTGDDEDKGCNCTTGGAGGSSSLGLLILLALVAVVRRRRR